MLWCTWHYSFYMQFEHPQCLLQYYWSVFLSLLLSKSNLPAWFHPGFYIGFVYVSILNIIFALEIRSISNFSAIQYLDELVIEFVHSHSATYTRAHLSLSPWSCVWNTKKSFLSSAKKSLLSKRDWPISMFFELARNDLSLFHVGEDF